MTTARGRCTIPCLDYLVDCDVNILIYKNLIHIIIMSDSTVSHMEKLLRSFDHGINENTHNIILTATTKTYFNLYFPESFCCIFRFVTCGPALVVCNHLLYSKGYFCSPQCCPLYSRSFTLNTRPHENLQRLTIFCWPTYSFSL